MPTADTPAPARTAVLAPLVLLVALGTGLGGLALPHTSTTTRALAPVVTERAAVEVAPVPLDLRLSRASRSRAVGAAWVLPVHAPLTSPWGPRWGGWHPGIDLGAGYGAPIVAAGAGVVIGAGYLPGESGYGQLVLIRHSPGLITAYAHTSRMFVHAGQHVAAGQLIALVGATGQVTGPHLHFEVRLNGVKINPVPWLRAHGVQI